MTETSYYDPESLRRSVVFYFRNAFNVVINSFLAKFKTTFSVCFFILTNYRLERPLYVELKD